MLNKNILKQKMGKMVKKKKKRPLAWISARTYKKPHELINKEKQPIKKVCE